ncbi:MAG TPA: hypothetical protein VEJ89_16960 [Myxococcaceae bacterium]|nr:hypothetical protein [Myxococcaceae bacterium]
MVSTPPSRSGTEPAGRRRGARWLPVLVLALALLTYGALFWLPSLFRRPAPSGTLRLARWESGGWLEVEEGVPIPPRSRLRLTVVAEREASVVILGLDAARRATLLVPATGTPPRVGPGTTVVGETVLGAATGPSLLLAELCNTPLPTATVVKAGERAVAAAPQAVEVETLDLGCPEARFRIVQQALP